MNVGDTIQSDHMPNFIVYIDIFIVNLHFVNDLLCDDIIMWMAKTFKSAIEHTGHTLFRPNCCFVIGIDCTNVLHMTIVGNMDVFISITNRYKYFK